MNGDAGQLSTAAQSLRDAGRPCRAVILDVLAAFPTDHLAAIIESRDISEDIVRAMAERTGRHILAVADVMRKFTQFDCAGYQAKYERLAVVQRLCQHAFDEFGLMKITAHVFTGNPASARVLMKCGFQQEGLLRKQFVKDGQFLDAMLFGLLR